MGRRRSHVVSGADPALNRFKYETAQELGLAERIRQEGWGNMTTRDAGRVGGQMVRRLIKEAETSLSQAEQRNPGDATVESSIT